MATVLWQTEITSVGADAGDLLDGGVLILFGEPVPDALAEVSVVHRLGGDDAVGASPEIAPGDEVHLAADVFTIDEVGEIANRNLAGLGHIVVYVNSPDQALLPGAVKATGSDLAAPSAGDTISFVRP
ncbi:PTS system glucitol/sorbitol-specific IIA component [Acidipropionibacterium acidipropionici ATCC 4875]|uniref:PTS system glucitol/sorbitol-specific IIA component n=1 Tax=Acidipropionibacterium acidipropionici (strain ATCC 4875 / DSM 20272 / JCM 6432 / NBRC 12425 / NCIMB 8070 / 4) TaxID=1171373 RepID=K7RUL2_ACIA4|nr:PTS glucitol/sorbitol transporter subunit IIA [Acidipropionibacterium acidipropionici]AFV88658.1 PTS system glucitol/sorbitol-specific IIA component [Acidipropionibacterium acidipropionici ATCC 4875]